MTFTKLLTVTTALGLMVAPAFAQTYDTNRTNTMDRDNNAMERNLNETGRDIERGATKAWENTKQGAREGWNAAEREWNQTFRGPVDGTIYSNAISAEEMEGMSVYASTGEQIGEIERILITPQGQNILVISADDGFLGMGNTKRAVYFNEAQVQGDDRVNLNLTPTEFNSRPTLDNARNRTNSTL